MMLCNSQVKPSSSPDVQSTSQSQIIPVNQALPDKYTHRRVSLGPNDFFDSLESELSAQPSSSSSLFSNLSISSSVFSSSSGMKARMIEVDISPQMQLSMQKKIEEQYEKQYQQQIEELINENAKLKQALSEKEQALAEKVTHIERLESNIKIFFSSHIQSNFSINIASSDGYDSDASVAERDIHDVSWPWAVPRY